MDKTTINIAAEFSPYPAGREIRDGPNSGEKFRETYLKPALDKFDLIEIQLDDVKGYPSSFTEEAFGGLVRAGYDKDDLLKRLQITYLDNAYSSYRDEIIDSIKLAEVE